MRNELKIGQKVLIEAVIVDYEKADNEDTKPYLVKIPDGINRQLCWLPKEALITN